MVQITQYTSPNYTDNPQVNIRCFEHFFTVEDFWAMRLAWRTEFALKFFAILKLFTVKDFWATCACPEKQSVPWNFSLYWIYIFYHSGFLSNLRLPWKTECTLKFFTVLNIFLHSGFLSNLRLPWKTELPWNFEVYRNIIHHLGFLNNFRLPWKQSVPWNFSLYWNILYHSVFLSNLRLPWKQRPEIFKARGPAALPDQPLRTPMHKIIDIGNFVRRSLSERDRITLLLNSWTPLPSYDFRVVHTGFQKRRFQMQWLKEFKWCLQWTFSA